MVIFDDSDGLVSTYDGHDCKLYKINAGGKLEIVVAEGSLRMFRTRNLYGQTMEKLVSGKSQTPT